MRPKIGNLEKFCKILKTKQALIILLLPSQENAYTPLFHNGDARRQRRLEVQSNLILERNVCRQPWLKMSRDHKSKLDNVLSESDRERYEVTEHSLIAYSYMRYVILQLVHNMKGDNTPHGKKDNEKCGRYSKYFSADVQLLTWI